MKNMFINLCRITLAILVIIGLGYLITGVQYLVLQLLDLCFNQNKLSNFDLYEMFKQNTIILCVIMSISAQVKNIKFSFNKEPKGIYKLLAKWRKERNITNSDYRLYFQNIIEELLEPLGYSKEEIKLLKIEIYNKYFPKDCALREDLVVDTICDIKVFSINELGTMKYNGKKCMKETIKEISSRDQDPFQKDIWNKNGASGKWQKWQEQPKETLYVADYSKCKL